MAIRKEFVIERQGKKAVLYAGLLDLAHDEGLLAIHTELVQLPSEENGHTAVMIARVSMEKDGKLRTFTGIGDANPGNVPRHIAGHILRMAETRAKARALRDAVNIGDVALEELDDDEPAPARSGNGHSKAGVPPAVNAQAVPPAGAGNRAALTAEYKAAWKAAREHGIEPYKPEAGEFESWDDARVRAEIAAMREALAKLGVSA